MPSILLPNRPWSVDCLSNHCEMTAAEFRAANSHCGSLLAPFRPYSLSSDGAEVAHSLAATPLDDRRHLSNALFQFGDLLPALAAFHERHVAHLDLDNLLDAGVGAALARSDGFVGAVRRYQNDLLTLHDHRRHGSDSGQPRVRLEQAAQRSYETLQRRFRHEMEPYMVHAGKNRGSPLTSIERGLVLAGQRRRHLLQVADLVDAQRLRRMATQLRGVGPGLMILDASERIRKVGRTKTDGQDWMRQATKEAVGFAAAGSFGSLAGLSAVRALTVGLALTPSGWIVVIAIAASAAYHVGTGADSAGQALTEMIWDRNF